MPESVLAKLLPIVVLLLQICRSKTNPNILMIIADDFGWADASFHRTEYDSEVRTPNIDGLVKEGLELMRHYVHFVCSPTRSSFQSGRLPVHVRYTNVDATNELAGVAPNMTCIANRMKQVGYTNHMVGKWDVGMAQPEQAPLSRGYDSSLIYFHHANDYWTQTYGTCNGTAIVDLWNTSQPAYGKNGTQYEEQMFADYIYNFLDEYDNDNDKPFFLVYTAHVTHDPLMIPKAYLDQFNFTDDENKCSVSIPYVYPGFTNKTNFKCRSIEHAMAFFLDEVVGNITRKLKDSGLWNDTLIAFSTDNGGCLLLSHCAGNNHPMRGGKFTPLEGGVRGTAFVSGGYLPAKRRGQQEYGIMHIADWMQTFCMMNGLDCSNDEKATNAGLPNPDSLNMWPLISGENETSPRTEIVFSDQAIMQNQYKYLSGKIEYASWAGEKYPNASSPQHPVQAANMDCSNGCLFDVVDDWTEHVDIAAQYPDIVKSMNETLVNAIKTFYQNNETGIDICPSSVPTNSCVCWAAVNLYKGFWGPWQKSP